MFNSNEEIQQYCRDYYCMDEVKLFTDYDYYTAFIGVTWNGIAVYDYDLMVEFLIETESMSEEKAVEWIDTNTACAYLGEKTPIILCGAMN